MRLNTGPFDGASEAGDGQWEARTFACGQAAPIDMVLLRAPRRVPTSAHGGPDDGLDDRAGPHVSRMQGHGEISASAAWAGAGTDRILVGAATR
jgi:hypothetical protein